MNREAVLMLLVMLALVSSGKLSAGQRSAEPPVSSTRSVEPSTTPGATTSEQVVRDKDDFLPHPEITPEEGEQLLRYTEIEDPRAMDNQPPSPPGLPLVRGRETQVPLSPNDPSPPAR